MNDRFKRYFLRSGGKEGANSATGPGAGAGVIAGLAAAVVGSAHEWPTSETELASRHLDHHQISTVGRWMDWLPWHWSGRAEVLHALGMVTASDRLTGTPSGTLPVRMRQAQLALEFTTAPSARQQSAVGDALLLVTKLRQGAKLVTSDAVHDTAAGPPSCPAAGAAAISASITTAAEASRSWTGRAI
jgi:hypothetical protein